MKIDLKDNKQKWGIIALLVIGLPILYNQGKGIVLGAMSSYYATLPV